MLAWLSRRLRELHADEALVEAYAVMVVFRCPCGSRILHRVHHLHEAIDCPRCGREVAVWRMRYDRRAGQPPTVEFAVGYVDENSPVGSPA